MKEWPHPLDPPTDLREHFWNKIVAVTVSALSILQLGLFGKSVLDLVARLFG